jgi:hypothetical protein
MENIIYEELIARLTSDEAVAEYTADEVAAPLTLAWFEGQPDQAVVAEGNITYPFDLPAIFIQFSETKYSGPPQRQKGEGEFTLHIAQSKTGKDGIEGNESHTEFKDLLPYIDTIINLLNGFKLECSARCTLLGVERDHTNRPIMVDQVKFSWSGAREWAPVADIPEP